MADLAFGAVHSLLGLLRDEAQALVRLGDDVQFIREEMESMNSFLLYLVQTMPRRGEHEGPVRAWMKQVRDLAFDCSNCIDLYVLRGRGSPARDNAGSRGFLGCLLWMPCSVPALCAQREAAAQIRELKARARDVGERRQRYGVELPKITADDSHAGGGGGGNESGTEATLTVEDAVGVVSDDFIRRVVLGFPEEPNILEERAQELVRWLTADLKERVPGHEEAAQAAAAAPPPPHAIKKVICIVAPHKDQDGGDVARKALEDPSVKKLFMNKHCHWLTVDYMYLFAMVNMRPKEGAWFVLRAILDNLLPVPAEDQWDEARMVKEIKERLGMEGTKSLFVIKGFHDVKGGPVWNLMESALSKFGCAAGSAVIVITKGIHDHDHEDHAYGVELPKITADDSHAGGGGGGDESGTEATLTDEDKQQLRFIVELPKITADDKQQLRFIVELPKTDDDSHAGCSGGGGGGGGDFIRRVVPEEPNILEKCAQELVRWLTADAKERVPGHEEAPQAAAAAPPPPHAIKKFICIVAPDKDQVGVDVARKALEDPSVKKLFRNKHCHWLTVDYMYLFAMVNIRPKEGAWFVLRAILDNLLPVPAEDAEMLARDKWDEARMVEEIKKRLETEDTKSLFVIEGFLHVEDGPVWKLMEGALSKFGCAAGSAVIVICSESQSQPIINYSLVDFFYFKAKAVVDRGNYKRNYLNMKKNLLSVLRLIHDRCERQAFCMKMFVHYLYAKPNRTKEELDKLLRVLVSPESSLDGTDAAKLREDNGKLLLKFCYEDLPRTYKACLLYLAIFPPDEKISRSRLVGRWIVEGLIIGRDMPHAVREAERCFDELLKRWLVIPGDIGATGKVKSCIVKNDLVKELIAEKAREEQFLDPRLSRHLAQHFSVHSDLRLRRSDNITNFVGSLRKDSRGNTHTSSQLMLLNVLDLEGCPELRYPLKGKEHFINNQRRYLKNIFSKILLLKYLSLRNTDVSELPKEINKLTRLEILDIRQTRVPSSATKYILLPRLKCLLAGRTEMSSTDNTGADETFSSVQIPRDIGKMENLEVLSHVEASKDADNFIHIGKQLCQLRKLGVVIDCYEDRLKNLLQAISDLNECLRSLSIRIVEPSSESCETSASKEIEEKLKNPPELLESLSISGITRCVGVRLLPLLVKGHSQLAKVTLHKTSLNQNDLQVLGKLAHLRCFRLWHTSYTENNNLTFKQDEFQNLQFLAVEWSKITSICFNKGATPRLEEITWSFTKMESLSGIDKLSIFRKIEFSGVDIPDQVRKAIAEHPNGPALKSNQPQDQGQGSGSAAAAAPSNTA